MKYTRKEAPYFAVSPKGCVVWSYGLGWINKGRTLFASQDDAQWLKSVAWSINYDGQKLIKRHGGAWVEPFPGDPEWEVIDGPEDLGILGPCESKTVESVAAQSARVSTSSTRSKKKVTRSAPR